MSALRHGMTQLLLLVFLSFSAHTYAQLGGLGGALGGAPGATGMDGDLSCAGRGNEGGLGCGEIGLEETLDLCEDKDSDYICDDQDECPDTPPDTPVFINGCHMVELTEEKPLVLRGVNFEFDQDVLIEDSIPILEQAVVVLNKQPDVLVSIDGHTDNKGSDSYNKRLSKARAKRVHQYFVDAGVSGNRLIYRGFGESRPIAPNTLTDGSDNPVGRAENRRVELSIVDATTFASIQQQIEADEARAAEERAAAALAAQQRAEEEAAAAEQEEIVEESSSMATAEQEPAMAEEQTATTGSEFDEASYLNFMSEESSSTEPEMAEPAAEPAMSEEPAASEEPAVAEESAETAPETAESEGFDESKYLDFLEPAADESAAEEEATAASGGETQDPGYVLEVQPVEDQ